MSPRTPRGGRYSTDHSDDDVELSLLAGDDQRRAANGLDGEPYYKSGEERRLSSKDKRNMVLLCVLCASNTCLSLICACSRPFPDLIQGVPVSFADVLGALFVAPFDVLCSDRSSAWYVHSVFLFVRSLSICLSRFHTIPAQGKTVLHAASHILSRKLSLFSQVALVSHRRCPLYPNRGQTEIMDYPNAAYRWHRHVVYFPQCGRPVVRRALHLPSLEE